MADGEPEVGGDGEDLGAGDEEDGAGRDEVEEGTAGGVGEGAPAERRSWLRGRRPARASRAGWPAVSACQRRCSRGRCRNHPPPVRGSDRDQRGEAGGDRAELAREPRDDEQCGHRHRGPVDRESERRGDHAENRRWPRQARRRCLEASDAPLWTAWQPAEENHTCVIRMSVTSGTHLSTGFSPCGSPGGRDSDKESSGTTSGSGFPRGFPLGAEASPV